MASEALASDPATDGADAARLAEWERRTRPLIIAAAVIPLVGISTGVEDFGIIGTAVEVACWVVFLVDLIVHLRLHPHYLKTGIGRFDLAVVVLTSPWYMLPGVDGGQFVALLRLARLARVLMLGVKTPVVKRTVDRLGKPFLYVVIMLFVCAAIVKRAEGGKDGFETFGDCLWWGVVTITTVGYGDLVPETAVGRFTATALMLTGVAVLGTVAASLASMFRLEDKADEVVDEVVDAPAGTPSTAAELRALREEVAALRAELATRAPHP